MKREITEEIKVSKHQDLIMEWHHMNLRIKMHLYGNDEQKSRYIKPTLEEYDDLYRRVIGVLENDTLEKS